MRTSLTNVEEANKQAVRRLFGAFGAADDEAFEELLAPDFVGHSMPPGCTPDADGMKKSAALFHAGVEECSNEIEDVIAEDDKVTVRYTTRARHTGELFGVPPSGRNVRLTGIEIYRLVDGKVAEFWGAYDMSDLFETA